MANRVSSNTKNNLIRKAYFTERNKHSKLIKRKKFLFLDKLNKAIEEGHVMNWKKFRQLKQENDTSPLLDKFDLMSFYEFFSELYKKPGPVTSEQPTTQSAYSPSSASSQKTHILNKLISKNEIENAIKNLKKDKSSSMDLISNEMLQSLNNVAFVALVKTFNHSLQSGKYP